MTLTPEDLATLATLGITEEEADRQLDLLRQPPSHLQLLRPCTIDDGILRLSRPETDRLMAVAERALESGLVTQFLPASGAASRMFGPLLAALQEDPPPTWRTIEARAWKGDEPSRAVLRLTADLERFPFAGSLAETLRAAGHELETLVRRGQWRTILETLLGSPGLGYADLPKGLISFHLDGETPRTALAEQLATGAGLAAGAPGGPGFHLTVSPGQESAFQAEAADAARHDGVPYRVAVSSQHPATGTLALSADGEAVRDATGRLLVRPGGHGALLDNLGHCVTSVVLLRNIDNVLPAGPRRDEALRWRRTLLGLLLTVQGEIHAALERLAAEPPQPKALDEVRALLGKRFGAAEGSPVSGDAQDERRRLIDRLDRPLRVCGMVPHGGEPGGGPFWVTGEGGVQSLQIVEGAQIDSDDPEQEAIWRRSTHFNPVDLACALADRQERRYELQRFADPRAVFVSERRIGGTPCRVLERPGLWNGAMAHWNTLFVEMPREVFAPVKSVFDLLRPEHQETKNSR